MREQVFLVVETVNIYTYTHWFCPKPCNHLWVEVGQDPGEDGILHQVVVGSSCQRVQMHQVLEITDLSSLEIDSKQISEAYSATFLHFVLLNWTVGLDKDSRFLPPISESLTFHRPVCWGAQIWQRPGQRGCLVKTTQYLAFLACGQ